MTPTPARERLYALLPTLYRLRDATHGEALRALLAVVDEQLAAIEDDIGALYESWFIETCPEWVVPYIGDLVGVRGLNRASPRTRSQRAFVANVLAFRRRKGTAAMLEQLARDVTGWPAHAVEYFLRVGTTQHLNHLRLDHPRTPDLRRGSALGLLDGPFDDVARTADVRRIGDSNPHVRGRHNLPNVGIHLWRLETAWVDGVPAAIAADAGDLGFYRFSPLGQDIPLWNRDRGDEETEISELSIEATVPGALRRRALRDALAQLRTALESGHKLPRIAELYFAEPVFRVRVDGTEVKPEEIAICNLQAWHRPPATLPRADGTGDWPIRVAVDPVLGRIALRNGVATANTSIVVGYYDAHVARLGAGGYSRSDPAPTAAAALAEKLAADIPQSMLALPNSHGEVDVTVEGGDDQLGIALAAVSGSTVIEILDSCTYELASFTVPSGARVVIRARERDIEGRADLDYRARPLLSATSAVTVTLGADSQLVLEGVIVTGSGLELLANANATFAAIHCTLVPGFSLTAGTGLPEVAGAPSITAPSASNALWIVLQRTISGPLDVAGARLCLVDSLIAAADGGDPIVAAATGTVTILATTIFGGVSARSADLITDSIVLGPLVIERNQQGCVRFSYFPTDVSVAPPAYRCQPALALANAPAGEHAAIRLRQRPTFTSARYGRPGFGQLADTADVGITTGASDESEMGAFQLLQAPQRLANLRASLDEYLRFGLEAGIFHAT